MNDNHGGQVAGSAAEIYEQFFVPALFAQWAPRVADVAQLRPGQRVLDVACGTGVLAREAARRVGPGGSVTGLDVNPGMLAVARRESPGIDWRQGAAEAIEAADASFDSVVSQFGLMFFRDRGAALREMHRTLVPGGLLAVAVWDELANVPGYAAMVTLLDRLFGPRIGNELRAPFCLGRRGDLLAVFADAGLPQAQIVTHPGTARFPSLESWIRTDVKGWTLADMIDDAQYAALQNEAKTALRDFVQPDGTVSFPNPAHIVTVV